MIFGASAPKIEDFWPHILPILPTGASSNDVNLSKYVINLSNQTYLPIIIRFGGHGGVFCKILSDFWSTSPQIDDFDPKFHLFYALELYIMI